MGEPGAFVGIDPDRRPAAHAAGLWVGRHGLDLLGPGHHAERVRPGHHGDGVARPYRGTGGPVARVRLAVRAWKLRSVLSHGVASGSVLPLGQAAAGGGRDERDVHHHIVSNRTQRAAAAGIAIPRPGGDRHRWSAGARGGYDRVRVVRVPVLDPGDRRAPQRWAIHDSDAVAATPTDGQAARGDLAACDDLQLAHPVVAALLVCVFQCRLSRRGPNSRKDGVGRVRFRVDLGQCADREDHGTDRPGRISHLRRGTARTRRCGATCCASPKGWRC